MAAAGAFFVTVSCVICGYHVYKEVWNPSIGEAFMFIEHGGKINSDITLDVFPNFRDNQYIKFLEQVKARSLEVCELF